MKQVDIPFLAISSCCLLVLSGINLASSWKQASKPPLVVHLREGGDSFFEASRVYGKLKCGDVKLAKMTAGIADEIGLDAGLVASKIATESSCNPLAVSSKGAVGLTQVMPKIWSCSRPRANGEPCWDFSRVNLFDPETNIRIGATILAYYMKKHGKEKGIAAYNGTGTAAADYAKLVMERAR